MTDHRLDEGLRLPLLALCMLLVGGSACADAFGRLREGAGPPALELSPRPSDGPRVLSSLQRIVRRFDFEEPDAPPNALPGRFYRYIAPGQGFPPFGSMRLSTEIACAGSGSFEFDLGGGSMSARIPTSVIPILPLADYVVSSKVRTLGLKNARARLVAWLHDKAGRPIDDSRAQSRLAQTSGEWETLSVEIHGDYPDAADLVLELQLVQPGQFNGQGIDPDQPRLEDITGQGWFDDVVVAHLPRTSLAMTQPGNIVRAPQTPELSVMVSEMTTDPLIARLRVFNLDGQTVFDSTFPAPRGRQAGVIRLPITTCGWYRALLDVTSKADLARRHWLDFVILPQTERSGPTNRFGVVLDNAPAEALASVPDLLGALRAGTAVVPVWTQASGSQGDHDAQMSRRQMIEQLLRRNNSLIFSLEVVPDQLARSANLESNQVLELVAKDSRLWRPYLDDVLVSFGLEVSRWQIGAPGSAEANWSPNLASMVGAATKSFSDFIPDPHLFTAWSMEQSPPQSGRLPAYAFHVPYQVQPEALGDYTGVWLGNGTEILTTLELLPTDMYTPRQRVVDLMQRSLHAWRAGFPLMCIAAPWQCQDEHPEALMPDPMFAPWHMLAAQLSGRSFAGELLLGDGRHCWIVRGQSPNDAALVAWTDLTSGTPSLLQTQLANEAVIVIDAFGNSRTVPPIDGLHTIALSDMPVFIDQVNLELVQFRGGVKIEPDFVSAISKVHEHQLVLHNPWDVAISRTIRLLTDDDWKLSPDVQEFSIHPRGEVRLPLTIVPQRSIIAGRKHIQADITLHSDRTYSMRLQTDVEVGLKNIDLAASWSVARNVQTGQDDLVITEAVTNTGDQPVNLDVYLLASGVGQNRRTIAGLGSGETAVRSFRIANGAVLLAGQQVRVGVAERDGVTRLNQVLQIGPGTPVPMPVPMQAGAPVD